MSHTKLHLGRISELMSRVEYLEARLVEERMRISAQIRIRAKGLEATPVGPYLEALADDIEGGVLS